MGAFADDSDPRFAQPLPPTSSHSKFSLSFYNLYYFSSRSYNFHEPGRRGPEATDAIGDRLESSNHIARQKTLIEALPPVVVISVWRQLLGFDFFLAKFNSCLSGDKKILLSLSRSRSLSGIRDPQRRRKRRCLVLIRRGDSFFFLNWKSYWSRHLKKIKSVDKETRLKRNSELENTIGIELRFYCLWGRKIENFYFY